jgi:hypothetical protein
VIPIDKQLHFLWSFFLAVLFMTFHPLGWLVALAFGVGKEIWDWFKYGHKTKGFAKMAFWDLVADIGGVITAMLIL